MSDPMQGYYYLHTNGSLIYKPRGQVADFVDSDFVKKWWPSRTIGVTPQAFLEFLQEAKGLGAKETEIQRLHDYNNLASFIPSAKEKLGIN